MTAGPDILALDFDGVLCDGMREYFDTSRRTYARIWPGSPPPGDDAYPAFQALRPVIQTGWEMPLLLRAIVEGQPPAAVTGDWVSVRDALVRRDGRPPEALVKALGHTLDEVRREWIAADPASWLERNAPYCDLDELRLVIAQAERSVLVTTKEGEFARLILASWHVELADIQGKEAGTHKCENLRALIAAYAASHGGRRPRVWFVEDRLATLEHVTTHPDLSDVGLLLAAWGYNTPQTRASLTPGGRVHLLQLAQFRRGLTAWPA